MSLVVALSACASWFGLEVLDELPEAFPLTLRGPMGQVTQTEGGHVAVDEVHDTEPEARTAWNALRAEATARGFAVTDAERRKKLEVTVLEGDNGKIELQCCARRADGQWLVLMSWFPPAARAGVP
ncbi:MAG: hypothetical protein AAF602_24475 [Myxococcota bacterium]